MTAISYWALPASKRCDMKFQIVVVCLLQQKDGDVIMEQSIALVNVNDSGFSNVSVEKWIAQGGCDGGALEKYGAWKCVIDSVCFCYFL